MRKKLKDMTPFERVEPRLKGLSNEEADDVAVQIIAQVFAKHIYIFKDGEEYYKGLMHRIAEATRKYTKEHSFELALGSTIEKHKDKLSGIIDKEEFTKLTERI